MQREVVEQLITQELLWQEAQRREFVADDNIVDQQLEQIKDGFDSPQAFLFKIQEGGFIETSYREDVKQQLSVQRMVSQGIAPGISISDEEVASFYTANIDQMQQPVEVRARHILIKPESAEPEAQQAAKDEAGEILAEIHAGEDFVKLATERSQGPSATQGGDLGFFGPGQMIATFEKAAFALQPGEVSNVVQTQFGYHVIRLEDRRGGDTAPLEQAADSIRAYLTQQRLQSEVETLVTTLRDEGDVEIFLNL
jgi:peptidyl-prolyl cis-trans isomerase C